MHRLRRFILDLAVRGKLVPQDPEDEPAAELLKRIAKEKARLVKAGEIKKPKKFPPIDEIPYSLPPSWRWTRIREITSDRGQRAPEAAFTYIDVTSIDKENGKVAGPKVLQAQEAPSRARKVVRKDDVVYSCVRPYLLNVAIVEEDFDPKPIASTAFAILNGHGLVLPRYLWIVLRSPFIVAHVEEDMRGQAYPAINDADFSVLPFPLPPLAEQDRIVAKVDELMGLCDRLEAEQTERETTRTRLTAASLTRLTASDPDEATFREHAAFALDNFASLTARPEQAKALRRTILNLAVRGKLVPQDPEDEPAAELLKRIAKEKTRLVKAGKIKKNRAKPVCMAEAPFELPRSWKWTTLGNLFLYDAGTKQEPATLNQDRWLLELEDVEKDTGRLLARMQVSGRESKSTKSEFRVGDILYGKLRPYLNKVLVADEPGYSTTEIVAFRPYLPLCSEYCALALRRPDFVAYVTRLGQGTKMPRLRTEDAIIAPFPLPPLAEQRRIVAKVDELVALCDRLEGSLVAGYYGRERLCGALLHRAVEPLEICSTTYSAESNRFRGDSL